MSRNSWTTLMSIVALTSAVGCTKLRRGTKEEAAPVPLKPVDETPLEAQKSNLGIIDLKVELRSDGMLLKVANVPAGAELNCNMEDKALVPCHDSALFERPADGEHKVTAVAIKDGAPVAYGESAPFSVLPGTGGGLEADGDPRNPLTLVIDDPTFKPGMPLPLNADFKAKFKYAAPPTCKAEVRCKYDSRTSQFWTECDTGSTSFTVAKDLMALGLQYFSAQATCGDQVGPILTLFWYGVPEGYEPLMLKSLADPNGRHVVELIRDQDCAEGQDAKFECAAKDAAEFALCDGNVFESPAPGYRVRFSCAGKAGPELILKP